SMSVCFFAHNNSTKDNLIARLPKTVKVFTFHGAGQSQIIKKHGYQALTSNRTENFIADMTGNLIKDMHPQVRSQWY
ncbi:hypothetical protein OE165_28930, partial [Escherichia coli]|uniref:hypothetical protein n=1 Tax=Escherichia coli TaxID=562 RepID=UPI0021F3C2ED